MVNMAELVTMIQERQGGESTEVFANRMRIRQSTLHRYYTGKTRDMSLHTLRKLAKYFKKRDDQEMIAAIVDYVLNPDQ